MSSTQPTRISRCLAALFCVLFLGASVWSCADEPRATSECTSEDASCVEVGSWIVSLAVGLGNRTNPVAENDDIPMLLLPSVQYYGKRFFWNTDAIGFTLIENERHMFNVIGTVSYDQMYFNEWGVGNFSFGGGSSGAVTRSFSNINGSGGGSDGFIDPTPDPANPNENDGGRDGVEATPTPVVTPDFTVMPTATPMPTFDPSVDFPTPSPEPTIEPAATPAPTMMPTFAPTPNPTPTFVPTPVISPSPEATPTPVGSTPTPTPEATSTPDPTGDVNSPPPEDLVIDFEKLHKRRTSGLMGLEYTFNTDSLSIGLQVLQEVTKYHHGHQVRGAFTYYLTGERSALALGFGAEWKDEKTLDYYFGIRPEEVDNRWQYSPGDGTFSYVKVDWRYRLSRHWDLQATVQHRMFPEGVKNSPLLTDDSSTAYFLGGVYRF